MPSVVSFAATDPMIFSVIRSIILFFEFKSDCKITTFSKPIQKRNDPKAVPSSIFHKSFSFRDLLENQKSKMDVVVTFLIILEMIKVGKIVIAQEDLFDDIMITSKVA